MPETIQTPPLARYQYSADYIPDPAAFRAAILAKTVKPHQVEWQPGPPGQEICWLHCPYCYGGSAQAVPDRLPLDRALTVLHEMADGGVPKMIFAGYATDPLFSKDLVPLVTAAVTRQLIIGFNTKALHVSEPLLTVLASPLAPGSYVSVSVDAGCTETYNLVHGMKPGPRLYSKVIENLRRLSETGIEVAATYLINRFNADQRNLTDFLADVTEAGVRVVRFAFAQLPRGAKTELETVATRTEVDRFTARVWPLIDKWTTARCPVLLVDADGDHALFRKARSLPCVARWVYPTVGYDGWLYPCSQTGAPDFRKISLGDLRTQNFWDLYYDYKPAQLDAQLFRDAIYMAEAKCRCDRKEHLVNIQASPAFGLRRD